MVGGTAGRLLTNGRGSRILFIDSTSHLLGSYHFHHRSWIEFALCRYVKRPTPFDYAQGKLW